MAQLSSIAYYVTDKISSNDISLAEYVTTDCILQNKKGREIATNLPPQPCSLIRYQRGDVLIANIRPYLKKVWFADVDGGASPDVTGFSFLGHLHEMMGGKLSCIIDARMVPVLPGAEKAADDFLYTAAGQRNRNHTGPYVTFENVPFAMEEVLFDPQTSGGLLLAVLPEEANALEAELQAAGLPAKIVGEIIPKTEQEITVKY